MRRNRGSYFLKRVLAVAVLGSLSFLDAGCQAMTVLPQLLGAFGKLAGAAGSPSRVTSGSRTSSVLGTSSAAKSSTGSSSKVTATKTPPAPALKPTTTKPPPAILTACEANPSLPGCSQGQEYAYGVGARPAEAGLCLIATACR